MTVFAGTVEVAVRATAVLARTAESDTRARDDSRAICLYFLPSEVLNDEECAIERALSSVQAAKKGGARKEAAWQPPPFYSTTFYPGYRALTLSLLFFLRRHRHGGENPDRHGRSRSYHCCAAVAGHDRRGAAAGPSRRPDRCALRAAEDRADDGAAHRAAADFCGAR